VNTRPNRILGVVVGGIIVVAVVTAVFAATRPVTTRDSGTPDGAVQAYLSAVLKGDNEEAAGFLAPDSRCDVQDLDRTNVVEAARVDLIDTEIDGDSARVTVEVSFSSGGGPFQGSATEDHTFRLSRSGDRWLLVGLPWPLYDCGGGVK